MEEDMPVRISELPRNVIHEILERMPIRDAVRTSILSKQWRYIWASLPRIKIDCDVERNDLLKITSGIILQHIGPILKFTLDISGISVDDYSYIDQWLLYLSRNGIRELVLHNSDGRYNPYELPSCILSCGELMTLELYNGAVRFPNTSIGLEKLTNLVLRKVRFSSNDKSCLNMPNLVLLYIVDCSSVGQLKICSPRLNHLTLAQSDCIEISSFINLSYLRFARFRLGREIVQATGDKRIGLNMLFGGWPVISTLVVDGRIMKFLAEDDKSTLEKLPAAFSRLRNLRVYYANFQDKVVVSRILYLLGHSPFLHSLQISVHKASENSNDIIDDNLEELGCMAKLQCVTIRCFNGSRAELHFLELLLSHSPSLEKLAVEDNEHLAPMQRLKISKDLMRLPRVSPKAIVIFEPGL